MKKLLAMLTLLLSIAMLSACAAPIPSMPPVTDKGEVYTNEAAGLSITYPEGWTVLTQEQIDALSASILEALKNTYKDPSQLENAKQKSVPASLACLHPLDYAGYNPNLNMIVQESAGRLDTDIVTFTNKVLDEMARSLKEGLMEFEKARSAKVGGLDAALVDMHQNQQGLLLVQKQYYVYHRNCLVIVTISSSDPADLDTLQRAVDNIRFK